MALLLFWTPPVSGQEEGAQAAVSAAALAQRMANRPVIRIASQPEVIEDARSAAFRGAEDTALALWRSGQASGQNGGLSGNAKTASAKTANAKTASARAGAAGNKANAKIAGDADIQADEAASSTLARKAEAKTMLYRLSTDAPPADAAAAKLRLGYMNFAANNKDEARRLWLETAEAPSGVNDAAKAEAFLRLAYSEASRGLRRARFERLASGEFRVPRAAAIEAAERLGAMIHTDGDLHNAAACYEEISAQANSPKTQARARVELAGIVFEQAKGEGASPIAAAERPAAFDRARALCREVLADGSQASPDRRMAAQLMEFETHYFQDDYAESHRLGGAFFAAWKNNGDVRKGRSARQYWNAARTFHAMNAYFTGHFDEALALADEVLADPPAAAAASVSTSSSAASASTSAASASAASASFTSAK